MTAFTRKGGRGRQPAPTALAIVLLALAAGVIGTIPVLLPLTAALACVIAVLLILLIAALSLLLGRAPAPLPAQRPSRTDSSSVPRIGGQVADGLSLRVARVLFFVGALTVTESAWRPAGVTVGEAALFGSLAFCCIAVLRGRSVELLPRPLAVGALLFAVGGLASSISATPLSTLVYEVGRPFWVMLLLPWTAAMVLRNRRDLVAAILLVGISGAVNALAAIAGIGVTPVIAGLGAQPRAAGFTTHPNDLGGAAGVAFVPILMLATCFTTRHPLWRIAAWALVGLLLAALAVSASVGGTLAALVAVIIWITSPSVRRPVRVAIMFGLAAVLVATSVPGGPLPSPSRRVAQVLAAPGGNPYAGSASNRLTMIAQAWPRISRDPLIGVGLDNPNLIIHNEAVAAWYAAGLFGLAGILLVSGAVVLVGWRAVRAATTDEDRVLGWSLVSAFVAFTLYAMTEPLFFQEFGWFTAALLVAWAAQVRRETALSSQDRPVHVLERGRHRIQVESRGERATVSA